jgi:hypothetical protein
MMRLASFVTVAAACFMMSGANSQVARVELDGGVSARPETACTEKIASLLSFADRTRLELYSDATKSQTDAKRVALSCAQDGILESMKSLNGSTMRIYQSGYYGGGVVLSFVDMSGKHLDMIPVNQRELRELGLNLAALDRVIPFAPQGLAPGLSAQYQTSDNARSSAKIFFASEGEDCRTACDGVRDAELDYCGSSPTEESKLNCRVRAWDGWKSCRKQCGK